MAPVRRQSVLTSSHLRQSFVIRLSPGAALVAALIAFSGTLSAQTQDPWAALLRPRTHTPAPTTPAITAADLMTRLYPFADDSMGGRLMGSIGNFKGVEYIARELASFGLEPAGEKGTFFQTVPVVTRTFDSTSTFSVDGTSFQAWVDYLPRDQGAGTRSVDGARAVYGGTWGNRASLISPEAVAGKLVVLSVGPPDRGSQNPPGTVTRAEVSDHFKTAAGIAVVGLDFIPKPNIRFYQYPSEGVVPDESPAAPNFMYVTSRAATLLLGASPETLKAGAMGKTAAGSPRFGERGPAYPARNVVAIIRGSDPALRDEFVAFGGHNDHIGMGSPVAHDSMYVLNHLFRAGGADDPIPQPGPAEMKRINEALAQIRRATNGASARIDSIYNGADDDGSGSMSLLEIAQYFASLAEKPKRSLLFVWHVGEEEGLYGSEYFTDHPTVPRDSIVAQLNIDMVGRGGAVDVPGRTKEGGVIHGDADYVQLIGSRRLSTEYGNLAETVNTASAHPLHFDYALDANGHPQNIYCRSDHYEYARYAIPIIFFTTGGHADYHQVTDEPQYIDYDRMARVARFVAELGTRVANLDHRVVVDQPKPDPHGDCRQ